MYFGKIKFFDYKVNNFGFIDNIYPNVTDEIYVNSEDVLCDKKLLTAGVDVVFEIKEIRNRKRAINLNLFSNLSLLEKQELSIILDGDRLHKFVYNLLKAGAVFTSAQKEIICKKILESPMLTYPFYTLDILKIINDIKYINEFIKFIINSSDLNKINLSHCEKDLLPVIANNWFFQNEELTHSLINKIKETSPSSDIYDQFIFSFQKELQKHSPDTVINFYSVFFNVNQITDYIKSIRDFSIFEETLKLINKYFIDEKRQQLLTILSNYVIENYSLFRKKLTDFHRYQLIINTDSQNIEQLLSDWVGDNFSLNENLINEINSSTKYFKYSSILKPLMKKILETDCGSSFLFSYHTNLKKYFDYLIIYKDYNFLEFLITTRLFNNENIFKQNLNHFTNLEVISLLKIIFSNTKNLEVKTKIEAIFLLNDNIVPSIAVVEKVAHIPISFLQQYVLKKIIYLHQKRKISNSLFQEILNIKDWTSLSAMLIISFIKNKPADKKSALNCLSSTFKNHLTSLIYSKIDEHFQELFTISLIVKQCNGRKYYKLKEWNKNNLQRYYTSKNNFMIEPPMELYCEGRFWKIKQLYDSQSKKPFQVKLYWCRGGICCGLNTKPIMNLEYTDITLVEISAMYKINLDELIFSLIGGWANRMNEIIERLKCRVCNSILRPVPFNPKLLGYYATPLFNCLNEDCSEYKKQIRFTHCLNGKCLKILDSRDLKTCSEGWMICTCNTCCPKHTNRAYEYKYVDEEF